MKSTLEYLCEQKDMAWHNRLCYSETYGMNTPKEGQEAQFAESIRDCEIVDNLIELVKSVTKTDPADSQPSQDYTAVAERKDYLRSALLDATPEHRRKLLEELNIRGRS